jgi:hypothetical protein
MASFGVRSLKYLPRVYDACAKEGRKRKYAEPDGRFQELHATPDCFPQRDRQVTFQASSMAYSCSLTSFQRESSQTSR